MTVFYDRKTFESKVSPGDIVLIINDPNKGDRFDRGSVKIGVYGGSSEDPRFGRIISAGQDLPSAGSFASISGAQSFEYANVTRVEKLAEKEKVASILEGSLGRSVKQNYESSFA